MKASKNTILLSLLVISLAACAPGQKIGETSEEFAAIIIVFVVVFLGLNSGGGDF